MSVISPEAPGIKIDVKGGLLGVARIDKKRLGDLFMELVRIDSISREEAAVCEVLRQKLTDLGATVCVDDAGSAVGGDTGNLIASLDGAAPVAPLLLSAHMDTVAPGRGIVPQLKNGVFTSAGDTILGADDKCGVAIILEVLTILQENGMARGPLEIVFSICEEIGLQGAKHLDYGRIKSRMGYVLDTRDIGTIIIRAPAANRFRLRVKGKSAHAGAHPERGINAIALAAQALAAIPIGRIDDETTCNIGTIKGGAATNIVPDEVVIEGEVRSHDTSKLKAVTDDIIHRFEETVQDCEALPTGERPSVDIALDLDFDRLDVAETHPVVTLARDAAQRLNHPLRPGVSGGGSDASVFFQHGVIAGVLGTGCDKVHTVDERVALDDMVTAAELLLEIVQLHARGKGAT